jgi:signal transduction histidine kinase
MSRITEIILSKFHIKLTLLFLIVGIVGPAFAIYYFYILSTSTYPETFFEQTMLLRSVALTIIILIALNAGIVGFLFSRSVTKPIKELNNATKEVEKGNYDIRLEIKSNDEIGSLKSAFNKTTAALGRMDLERKEIDSAKTEFLSITSHELRSPMTPMKAQLQMLQEGYFGKLTKKQKESLSIVIRNADRLDNIIVDFLDISRIEAARLKFNFKETDIVELVNDIAKFMQGFANEKNITLDVNCVKLPKIEVDPDRLSQVLRNLINNAIKFSKENSTIKISAKLQDNKILFSVRDYGVGLTEENQIRIFEPFYQVESAARRRHGGTGLGLAICRGIVEAQKGKIWVESKTGKGSKFNFTVPLTPVRRIEPIKVLFSQQGIIQRKIKDEFKSVLGPMGEIEFDELKAKNALDHSDLINYINSLTKNYIISNQRSEKFKNNISQIFNEEKEDINEKKDIPFKQFGEEMLKRD